MRIIRLLRSITKIEDDDFEKLAQEYEQFHPGFSPTAAQALKRYVGASQSDFVMADIGSGTGDWVKLLSADGLSCICVEPSDAMREVGVAETQGYSVQWRKGTGTETTLADQSVNWVTMANAIHRVDFEQAMAEFKRILKPGGYLTIMRHHRKIKEVAVLTELEDIFRTYVPNWDKNLGQNMKRYRQMNKMLISGGLFEDVLYLEGPHFWETPTEDYMASLQSLEAVQTELSPETFTAMIRDVETLLSDLNVLKVPIPTEAWTARV